MNLQKVRSFLSTFPFHPSYDRIFHSQVSCKVCMKCPLRTIIRCTFFHYASHTSSGHFIFFHANIYVCDSGLFNRSSYIHIALPINCLALRRDSRAFQKIICHWNVKSCTNTFKSETY
ncbi:hypothetical protein ANTQUA_LOCUS4856 [Anthophora quadrimaculata]